MSFLPDLLERVRALVFRRRAETDLTEELRYHVERDVEERVRRGAESGAARRAALLAFGGVDRYSEEVRDARGVRVVDDIVADVRYAFRALRRSPVFSAASITVLALGIGASTAVFSIADAVLFADLPHPQPDRLVRVYQANPASTNLFQLSTVDFNALRAQQRSFEAFGVVQLAGAALSGAGAPQQVLLARATSGFFQALRAPVISGRLTDPRDDQPGATPVVVVSSEFAERNLGGVGGAVGRSLTIDGVSHSVIGVLAKGVDELAGIRSSVWPALRMDPPTRKGPFWLRGIGRLRSGATIESATQDLAGISARLFPMWASSFRDSTARMTAYPLQQTIVGNANRQVGMFAGAVALVLLVAVVNVATLMLVRSTARGPEFSIRTALGAGRVRLVQLALTESVLLALLASLAGIAVASAALRGATIFAGDIPHIDHAALNARALLFAAGTALVSGLLISISSIPSAVRKRNTVALGADARRAGTSRQTNALRGAFVTAEFALALPLLFGAGLLLNSFLRLQRVDPGYDAEGAVAVRIGLPSGRYPDFNQLPAFWQRLEQRASEIAGVSAVGLANNLPPDNGGDVNNFDLLDRPVPAGTSEPVTPWSVVTTGFFQTLGIPLLEGRLFTAVDTANGPPVVVVSRAWARRYYPGESAVGRQMVSGGCTTCPPTTVIGVVGDVKYLGLGSAGEGVYEPLAQSGGRTMHVVVRTNASAASAFRELRSVAASLDPELPVTEITLQERIDTSLAAPAHWTGVLSMFAGVGNGLALIGIFGLMMYSVRQRRREIGVRMALGAAPQEVMWMIVGRGMRYALPGTLIGVALALWSARWLKTFLYGIGATDLTTLLLVAGLLICAAVLTCWIAGLRAARIQPVEAIGAE